MNPPPREGWGPAPAPPRPGEQTPRSGPPSGSYISSPQGPPPPQPSGSVLPPPPPGSSFYNGPPPPPPPSGPNLPSIAGMPPQNPPLTPSRAPMQLHEQNTNTQPHNQQQPGGYQLPSINQPLQPAGPPSVASFSRERDAMQARERGAREFEYEAGRREQQRERELQEQQIRERAQATPQPAHAEPIQMHQPTPVGPQMRNIQNGLLSNGAPPSGPPPGPPNGQVMVPYDRTPQGTAQQVAVQNMLPFPTDQGMQQMAVQGVAPGQQPILNDALSYLDQVKVQFSGNPDVYNQFLDIMKDFKSQAIDTPGVIGRVSQLFKGNPTLIQGFNTFLPPGYRIECGISGDPNQIRVTTPMGTTHSPMGSAIQLPGKRRDASQERGADPHPLDNVSTDSPHWPRPTEQAEQGYANNTSTPAGPAFGARASPFQNGQRGINNDAFLAHQQEERGVTQLQNAVSAAQRMSPIVASADGANGATNGTAANQQSAERRNGPVEFNHAISYVNKIKNRFSSQPEIYKQFLEILQTYQRESKPIGDVYAQVTSLFNGAPDLLEDFKQFLPESAAHAKAIQAKQAAEDATVTSNARETYGGAQHQTPRADQGRMPPMGQFAPTPANREGKRKRGADRQNYSQTNTSANAQESGKHGHGSQKQRGKQAAQTQHSSKYQVQPEAPAVEPTLVPALPEPMPPSRASAATTDEVSLFDRIKKALQSKNVMTEFLKLCNLYSQDLIDKNLLVFRAHNFLGSNPELYAQFKTFLNYEGVEHTIENKARPTITGRVNLNNCRALGQSYRHLPQRERYKQCSGRDELCNSVLNDEWVSHPTWASEDSGFIAHKKNTYEESLHRIEEERHDYDLHISSLERMIQFLEPLSQQIYNMDEASRKAWQLEADFAGQSQPIYQKMLGKIYGRDKADGIMQDMIFSPASVIPIIIQRSRQIAETWKQTQREWEKVWRDQTQRMFYRSLDHQGNQAKQNDKRQFQSKTLQNEVQYKFEEQKRLRLAGNRSVPNFQFQHHFADEDVIFDAARLMLIYADQNHAVDLPRLQPFLKEFIPLFFGLDLDTFQERMDANFAPTSTPGEDADDDGNASEDASSVARGRRMDKDKRDLRRGVLDRGRSGKPLEGSASHSRASTPGVASATGAADENDGMNASTSDDGSAAEPEAQTWIHYFTDGQGQRQRREIKPNEPYRRQIYNLYGNLPVYCFFRMFTILYERLSKLKASEAGVREVVRRSREKKAAVDLGMVDKDPGAFFVDTTPGANYYAQMLQMFEELVKGELEMQVVEDVLRRFYLHTGWLLFSFERMLSSLTRFAIAVLTPDGAAKDRTPDILEAFKKDRRKDFTTHADELAYRRQVEKYVKDSDVYRIAYNAGERKAFVRLLKRDENTYDNVQEDGLLDPDQRWSYYVSSFQALDPTENVLQEEVGPPLLKRSRHVAEDQATEPPSKRARISVEGATAEGGENGADPVESAERTTQVVNVAAGEKIQLLHNAKTRWDQLRSREYLGIRVDQDSYKLAWPRPGTGAEEEWWLAVDVPANQHQKQPSDADKDTERNQDGDKRMAEAAPQDKDGDAEKAKGDEGEKHDEPEIEHRFEESFVMNNRWMRGLSRDEVDGKNRGFREWMGTTDVVMEG
ncbi:MAG: hypothetical protein Q9162_007114 [Coniocarpon cinnabarinum]